MADDKVEKALGAADKLADTADKIADASIEGVKNLASAVESVAPKVWEILCRQMMIEGITDILLGMVFLILSAYVFKKIFKHAYRNWSQLTEDQAIATTIGCIAAMAVLIGSIFGTAYGIKKTVNPQYYAAEFLIEKATGNK
jgi:hypothetical protein